MATAGQVLDREASHVLRAAGKLITMVIKRRIVKAELVTAVALLEEATESLKSEVLRADRG